MLEGIEEIDWGALQHAYGAASDVPDLLRALASPIRRERSSALSDLYGNIWHQGTVYEATAYAVPFLIELLREPEVQDKAEILGLLQAISVGNSYHDVHQDMEWYRHERHTDAFQEQVREELTWVRKASDAVCAGMPVYRTLLDAASLKLRVWTAYLLAYCIGRFQDAAAALRARLRHEEHPLAKASLVCAWISLCQHARRQRLATVPSVTVTRKLLRTFVRSRREKAIVRLVAGLGLMLDLPEKDYPGFARFFGDALARCPRMLERLPWTEGEPMQFVYQTLSHQRSLVLDLFSSIARTAEHPHREAAIYYLEEIIRAQPRARLMAARLLGELLDSANGKERQHAARILGQMGRSGKVARDDLSKALGDADEDVARYAAVALSKMDDVRVIPFLVERLARRNIDERYLDAIMRLGREAVSIKPLLRQLLERSTGNVRILAAQALARMGEASTDTVLDVADVLRTRDAAGAGYALMLWGPLARAAIPRIVDFLQTEQGDALARSNAIKALGSMGSHARPALGVLEQLLREAAPDVRIAAALAIWKVASPASQAVPVVLEVLREYQGNPRANHVCASALETLETIGPAARSAAPLVRALLDDPYQWTRVRAARALWRIGEPVDEILPVLIDELRCRPVGLLAAECVAEIGPPAAAAVPRLREILCAEGSVSEGGLADEIVEQEEKFLEAVSSALRAIEGNV